MKFEKDYSTSQSNIKYLAGFAYFSARIAQMVWCLSVLVLGVVLVSFILILDTINFHHLVGECGRPDMSSCGSGGILAGFGIVVFFGLAAMSISRLIMTSALKKLNKRIR